MKIFILRHGSAEPRGKGVAEAERKLIADGELELKAVLRLARHARVSPQLILTSPWTRALDSARMAQKALKCDKLKETKSLLPDVAPQQIWREIHAEKNVRELLIAGHEPHLSRFAAFLLEAPVAIDLKKGGMLRIDVEDHEGPPRGVLKWALTPKLAGKK
jgi:phosphohistidine phosphatase